MHFFIIFIHYGGQDVIEVLVGFNFMGMVYTDTMKYLTYPLNFFPSESKLGNCRVTPISLPENMPFCEDLIGLGTPDCSYALQKYGERIIATPLFSRPPFFFLSFL